MIKILIVEDEEKLARFVELELKHEGYEVIKATNGRIGLEIAEQGKVDLVLLDVMLPEINGLEVLRRLRRVSNIPIIMLTARDAVMDKVSGLDAGADDYITKPIRVKELVSRINAVLRRKGVVPKKEENKNKIISGDITVELLKYKVYKNDKVIELTTIEYKLLLLLIKNNGNVLERNLLLERLWDTDGNFVDGNSLTVYIKRLREKVKGGEKWELQTVWGVGYKFEVR